jgi:hypothetical protein
MSQNHPPFGQAAGSRRQSYPAAIAVRGRLFGVPWPFGSIRVSADEVRAYSRLAPWFPAFRAARPDITAVILYRTFWGPVQVRIEDKQGQFARVTLQMQMRAVQLAREADRLGYPVIAEDRWLAIRAPWDKKGWSAPARGD